MQQYGDIKKFDHKPTELEKDKAVEEIVKILMPYINKNAIVKHYDVGEQEMWTVGVKLTF